MIFVSLEDLLACVQIVKVSFNLEVAGKTVNADFIYFHQDVT